MNTIKYLFPFTYFLQSRLQKPKDILFHGYYEWFLNVLLLIVCAKQTIFDATLNFSLCYIAFISIYELGYLYNDVISVRFDPNPRRRIKNFNPNNTEVCIWAVFRLAVFAFITYYLKVYNSIEWWSLYALLALFYTLHNEFKNKQLKPFTFVNLAYIRFFAPIFLFIPTTMMAHLSFAIFLNYVLYRTLTYMDSKALLNIPDRPKPSFKVGYYLLIFGVSAICSLLTKEWIYIAINAYYLIFWLLFWTKEKVSS